MPHGHSDARAVEDGLRSIERLIERGDEEMAAFALDLLGPALRAQMDDSQEQRLRAAETVVGHPSRFDLEPTPTLGRSP